MSKLVRTLSTDDARSNVDDYLVHQHLFAIEQKHQKKWENLNKRLNNMEMLMIRLHEIGTVQREGLFERVEEVVEEKVGQAKDEIIKAIKSHK